MKAREFIREDITPAELQNIDRFADALWAKLGIDIKFTQHFVDRVNDPRNVKPITAAELIRLFRKEYEQWGQKIRSLDDRDEAVLNDLLTNINLPFVMREPGSDKDPKELVAKTVMRKQDFKTLKPRFPVK